ncbi:hypothetical protein EC912_11222 [Luteibacter rhizovicinus]|uniref:DUF3619 family protein n=1 Tax=Luteibacter rhizovicinus TaxID=242606 RepID=A0A4R3YGH5_9GAMM|nr:hypothetical protein [Luteibacter rhizovicinus]TCV91276.1 hypothetical protein EC912_11222 [Luteibacter rhizovicinus]
MSQRDEDIKRRARELYLRASSEVDPATAGRLRAARRNALDKPQAHATRRMLLPAGAFAVVALASLMLWQPLTGSSSAPTKAVQSVEADSDLPPDADSADPALYQNLDFYGWLATDQRAASPTR